jgi:hypothetical protein
MGARRTPMRRPPMVMLPSRNSPTNGASRKRPTTGVSRRRRATTVSLQE